MIHNTIIIVNLVRWSSVYCNLKVSNIKGLIGFTEEIYWSMVKTGTNSGNPSLNKSQYSTEQSWYWFESKQLKYVSKLDMSVLNELNEIQLTKCIDSCDSLMKNEETDPFFNVR